MRETADDPFGLLGSWLIALEAEGKAPKTIEGYRLGVEQLAAWLAGNGHPVEVDAVTADQVRQWLITVGERCSPATVATRHKGAKLFFDWCVAEGELGVSPMANVPQPTVPEKHTNMLTDGQLRSLIADCAGDDFTSRRDLALVLLLADTGCRLSEVTNLQLDDLDLRRRVVKVTGKGSRHRTVPFGARTARALDRYLRTRRRHAYAHMEWVWLGSTNKGRLTTDGVKQLMRRRGERVGVKLHPHMLRHGFADAWLKSGGSETDLMELAGWRSRQMLIRYGAINRAERAREAHRQLSPMDRL